MRKILLLGLFFIFYQNGISQTKEIDSLHRKLLYAKNDTAKINLYNKIADKYKTTNIDSLKRYTDIAFKVSEEKNYVLGKAISYINYANLAIIKGNYGLAKKQLLTAKNLLENLKNTDAFAKNNLARCYATFGVIYSEESNYAQAIDYYNLALKSYVETHSKSNISKIYNNLGIIYKSEIQYNKALDYFKKALEIQEETGEQAAAVTLSNIGSVYFLQNNLKAAYDNFTKANKLFEKTDNARGHALLLNYLGEYFQKINQLENAILYYNKSLEKSKSIQDQYISSLSEYNLGKLYYEKGNYQEAKIYSEKSLELAKNIGVLDQTYHSEKLLSEIFEKLGNHEASLFHFKNYIMARDSIINQENHEKFLRSEMNFEHQMKEQLATEKEKQNKMIWLFSIIGGILLLGLMFLYFNRKQVKRKLTMQKEIAEYEQKALHLQMNPHFVFNCLGSISSFIVQNGTDQALKYLSKFSKLMRATLEYSKQSLIPIDKEIESLQNYLELEKLRFHNKFDFVIESSPNVEFNMGIPPLLVQPFVENAILHGLVPKETNGFLKITFDVENHQMICKIIDDGIGISNSVEMKKNSVTAHQSRALEITKKRLEMMETTTSKTAQIAITENNGTTVTLTLPIQYIK